MRILIISYPRSGTHFLINTIGRNSEFPVKWIDVPKNVEAFPDFIYGHLPDKRIYKAHHQLGCWLDFVPRILKKFRVFYMVRDVRDVMTSRLFYHNRNPQAFKTYADVRSLAFDKRWIRDAYSPIPAENMVQDWANHVRSWAPLFKRVCVVRYEKLHRHFEHEVGRIFKSLSLTPPEKPLRPEVGGISPRKGIVGDYKTHLTDADAAAIVRQIGSEAIWLDDESKI